VSAGEFAAVVVAVAVAIGVAGLLFAIGAAIRTMGALRRAIDDVHRAGMPLLADTHAAVRKATDELDKVDSILATAESITKTVDSASKLAHAAFSSPVVKAVAMATGSARAFRRLRKAKG
jgi:hypothetical protein